MNSARSLLAAMLTAAFAAATIVPHPALAQETPQTPSQQPTDPPAPKERVAAIKKSFADSQARLRKYEWIETTVISLKGEEKSRKQNRCYYGAEGKVEKVPLVAPTEDKPARGLIGKIKEKKKEELADYMEEAAALLHSYLPPNHEKIQQCADAGKVSIHILEPGTRARVDFRDYLQPGDLLSVEINPADNTILGVSIASALGQHKDPVSLDVRFDKFPDGTIYTAETNLEAKAKHVKVNVQNSGYKPILP